MKDDQAYFPFPTTDEQTSVGRLSERIARRELLKRGGKLFGALTLGGVLAGSFAGSAFADSPDCSVYGCACSGGTCFYNGNVCPQRPASESCNTAKCPSGGYCWSAAVGSDVCTYCDYWCHTDCSNACRCTKCQRPGLPASQASTSPDGVQAPVP